MGLNLEKGWKQKLQSEFKKDYFKKLAKFVELEYKSQTIYPASKLIFNALNKCHLKNIKVVIAGQDPYHGPNQANGLCFSVNDGVAIPPSLRNIYKELENDIGKPPPKNGNLQHWAKQGVLMLNATLTVRKGEAGSHQNVGWEQFTDKIIKIVAEEAENVVFLLWGSYAQKKVANIDLSKHYVLTAPHPSPFSADRGFFGCKHFSKTNTYLKEHGKKEVNW